MVLLLLVFFTIIIRLTTDTTISCDNFIGPIPIDLLQGCNGYRFYMVFNVLTFISYSTDFIDSLQQISLDNPFSCPWNDDITAKQLYTDEMGVCLPPEKIVEGTPDYCNPATEIIECAPENNTILEGCMIKRSDYNISKYTLKDVSDYNEAMIPSPPIKTERRIIIKRNPMGSGYVIDPDSRGPAILDSQCRGIQL